MNIWYGSNESKWLSNLFERRFVFEGKGYVSVEHAYQSLKSGAFDSQTYERNWKCGSKFVGKMGLDKKNNISLMGNLIFQSFVQNPALIPLLVALDGEFTHHQDNGIWEKEFPRLLGICRGHFKEVLDVRSC